MSRLADGRALPAIEVAPPDIEPFRRGNVGVDFVHRLDSFRPGPAVAIAALTHGNETCGATAAIWLLSSGLRPTRGTLTIWFGNVAAYRRLDAADLERTRLQARFVRPFLGFEELRRGEPILVDGGGEVVAPVDRCAVLMPWASIRKGREMVTIAEIVP